MSVTSIHQIHVISTHYEKAQEKAKKAGIGIWTLEDYVTERGFDRSRTYPGGVKSRNVRNIHHLYRKNRCDTDCYELTLRKRLKIQFLF